MFETRVRIRPDQFQRSFERFAAGSRKAKRAVLLHQAKLGVRDVVTITPPGHSRELKGDAGAGTLNSTAIVSSGDAKKAGEGRIRRELGGIMRNSRAADAEDARTIHDRYRRRSDGRVHTRLATQTRDNRHRVSGAPKYLRETLAKVGLLAAGWLSGAQRLGVRLPAWITRHGSSGGSAAIRLNTTSARVRVVNSVRFIGNVKDLVRRVQWVVNNRARQMDKQMEDYAVKRAARAAGLRLR